MTDWAARDLEIDFSFLPEGNFTADTYQDGVNAEHNASDYQLTRISVSRSTKQRIHLVAGGGWAANTFAKMSSTRK